MDWQGWFTVALTVAVLATLIAIPRLTTDLVLMGALLLLSITGILKPDEALSRIRQYRPDDGCGDVHRGGGHPCLGRRRSRGRARAGAPDRPAERAGAADAAGGRAVGIPEQHAGGGDHDPGGQPVGAADQGAQFRR